MWYQYDGVQPHEGRQINNNFNGRQFDEKVQRNGLQDLQI